jgi:hypothetical protein
MSDALPLPPRPDLDQYRTLAKDLQRAARASDSAAVARWARRWLERLAQLRGDAASPDAADPAAAIEREAARLADRWRAFSDNASREDLHDGAVGPKLTHAQFFVARAHGFAGWPAFVAHLEALQQDASPTALFESAVDAIVAGDSATLQRLLRAHPELAHARSTRDHHSTLLHYVSANGVEDFRQVTPKNIILMTEMLVAAGADVNAASEAYGGGSTPLGLAATSLHPAEAGVQTALLETLLRHGARLDGGQAGNGHGIVLGCLANGQPEAARFFADRGAQMSLVEAAGVGELDRVRTMLDTSTAAQSDLDAALQYAAGYGHADVVRLLRARGAERRGESSVVQLAITTREINICALTSDGREAITAAQGNPVAFWNAETGQQILALDPDSTNAWVASLTSDPRLVFAGSRDGTIGLWDIERRARVCVLRGHHGQPRAAQANAAMTRALTGCSFRDTTVKLWDLQSGACLRTLGGHTDGVYAVAFRGDEQAASGSRDTTIRIWDLDTGATLQVLRGHTSHVHGVACSRDGRRLLSSSMDVRLWDADTGGCVRVFDAHTEVIRSVVWSPDERFALSASHDRTARLWHVDSGECVRVFEPHVTGLVSASFSDDGRRVFTCDWLGEIRTWRME